MQFLHLTHLRRLVYDRGCDEGRFMGRFYEKHPHRVLFYRRFEAKNEKSFVFLIKNEKKGCKGGKSVIYYDTVEYTSSVWSGFQDPLLIFE